MIIRPLKTALFCVLLTFGLHAQADENTAKAPKPADAVPVAEPKPIVVVRTDIYGNVTARAGKNVTMQALVATNSDPIPAGSKGILFRKIEKADGQAGAEYVVIAKISFKKLDAFSSKVTMVIDEEMKDVLVNGKKSNHFAKNTKVKLQIDVPAPNQ